MSFNLADLFLLVAGAVPDREALVVGRDGEVVERHTYAGLRDRVARWARLLDDAGVGPGDVVGCHLRNGSPYVEVMLAAFARRAVPVNLNYRYVADELGPVLADAGVGLLLTEPDLVPVATTAAAMAAAGLAPAGGGGPVAPRPEVVAVDDHLADRLATMPGLTGTAPGAAGDDHYVLYTGGTTGAPKGVVWRHEDLFFAALGGPGNPRRGVPAVVRPADVVERARRGAPPARRLPLCPLVHGAAQWVVLQALLAGGTAILSTDRRFDAASSLALLVEARAELVLVVGDATARPLADALEEGSGPTGGPSPLPDLQVLSSSGAGLSPAVADHLRRLLPGVTVLDTLGASETGGQGRLVRGAEAGPPRLVPDADTTVLDAEGRPVAPGGTGRLARRGRIPLGYHRDPVRTAATFPVIAGVRWAVPGDLARVEDDGSFTLLGRGSVCINTGGEKVHPEEVEAVLRGHPSVADAVVVGVSDERYGARVAAVVAPRAGEAPASVADEQEWVDRLGAHVRSHLAGYKVPRRWVVVPDCHRLVSGKADYRWAEAVASGPAGGVDGDGG